MSKTIRILLDIGFNTTKVQGDGKPRKFLSTIKKRDNDFRQSEYVLKHKDNVYLVGEIDGRGSCDNDRSQDEVFEVCLLNAVASQIKDTKETDVRIVTGLPMKNYKKKVNRLKIIEKFVSKNLYNVVLNGKKKNFRISKIVIFPQGAGLDLLDPTLTEGDVIVIDIGGGTVDVSIFRNGKWIDGDSKRIGINTLLSTILQRIEREYNVEYQNNFEAEEIIKRKYIIVDDKKVDVSKIVDKALEEKAEEIIETVKSMFPTYWTTSRKVFIGGGSDLLRDNLKKVLSCTIVKNAEYTNLKIYGEVGRIQDV